MDAGEMLSGDMLNVFGAGTVDLDDTVHQLDDEKESADQGL